MFSDTHHLEALYTLFTLFITHTMKMKEDINEHADILQSYIKWCTLCKVRDPQWKTCSMILTIWSIVHIVHSTHNENEERYKSAYWHIC